MKKTHCLEISLAILYDNMDVILTRTPLDTFKHTPIYFAGGFFTRCYSKDPDYHFRRRAQEQKVNDQTVSK